MYDSDVENAPLICDKASDDECIHHRYNHSRTKSLTSSRTKYKIRGAAAIFGNAFDDFYSYVWKVVIVVGICFFVSSMLLYKMLFFFASLPILQAYVWEPTVHINIFEESLRDTKISHYLSYIDDLAERHPKYEFNIRIIVNDINTKTLHSDLEYQNDLDVILSKQPLDPLLATKYRNVNIFQSSLTTILNNSPINKTWPSIPENYIPFLVRLISIWENGGIALDPHVLFNPDPTKQVVYNENLEHLLYYFNHRYVSTTKNNSTDETKAKKRVNNIQDVIESLNLGEPDIARQNLTEEENHNVDSILTTQKPTERLGRSPYIIDETNKTMNIESEKHTKNVSIEVDNDIKSTVSMMSDVTEKSKEMNEDKNLFIDYRGTMVATKAFCHAFIGSIFSSVARISTTMDVDDFIFEEMIRFCGGNLSDCKGIVILDNL